MRGHLSSLFPEPQDGNKKVPNSISRRARCRALGFIPLLSINHPPTAAYASQWRLQASDPAHFGKLRWWLPVRRDRPLRRERLGKTLSLETRGGHLMAGTFASGGIVSASPRAQLFQSTKEKTMDSL